MFSLQTVTSSLLNFRRIQNWVISNRKSLVRQTLNKQLSEPNFYLYVQFLSAQSAAPLCEEYFRQKNRFKKRKNIDLGDFQDTYGNHYEYKCSLVNQKNCLNVVQIRKWQDIAGYYIQKVTEEEVYTFQLSRDHMSQECVLLKATSAHGSKKTNKDNKHIELRFTMKVGSDDWYRWCDTYLIDRLNLKHM